MPQPKRKHTRMRRDKRRASNWTLTRSGQAKCSNPACGKPRPPHTICPHCGFYGDKLVRAPKVKKTDEQQGGEQK